MAQLRIVAVAIARKIALGFGPSSEADLIGGSTYTFTVTPGHPKEQEVKALLKETRVRLQRLWDEVALYDSQCPPDPRVASRISYYCGQLVEDDNAVDAE